MAAIAKEAGVALKTVYLAFETKSGLLRALWNLRLRGDEDDVPITDREWYQAVLSERDPERKVRMGAHNARLVKERAGGLLRVIRDAAPADPDIGFEYRLTPVKWDVGNPLALSDFSQPLPQSLTIPKLLLNFIPPMVMGGHQIN